MNAVRQFAPIAFIALVLVLLLSNHTVRHLFTIDSLRTNQHAMQDMVRNHPIASLAAYMAVYAAICALCLPFNLVATLAGGFMFGTWLGGGATVLAGMVGSLGAYYAARSAFGAPLRRLAERRGGMLQKAIDGFGKNAFSYVLSLRLVPVFPFWMVSVAAGIASPPVSAFALGTGVGIIPASLIYAGLGSGLGKAFASGEHVHLSIIFAPQVIVPLLGLAVLSLAPALLSRLRKPS